MATTDPLQFASQDPEVAFMQAKKVSQETGADIQTATTRTSPQGFLSAESIESLSKPVEQFGTEARPGEFEDFGAPQIQARAELLQQLNNQYAQSAELETVDRGMMKRKMMREMNPTEDVDDRIRELMKEKFVQKALLNDQLKDLSPGQRRVAVANRLKVYGDTIDNLMKIRKGRLEKMDEEIDERVGSLQAQHDSMTARLNVLKEAADQLDKIGADRETAASMQLTIDKARADLERTKRNMNKAGVRAKGATDEQLDDIIVNMIASGEDVETAVSVSGLSNTDKQKLQSRIRDYQIPELSEEGEFIDDPMIGPLLPGQERPTIRRTIPLLESEDFRLSDE